MEVVGDSIMEIIVNDFFCELDISYELLIIKLDFYFLSDSVFIDEISGVFMDKMLLFNFRNFGYEVLEDFIE